MQYHLNLNIFILSESSGKECQITWSMAHHAQTTLPQVYAQQRTQLHQVAPLAGAEQHPDPHHPCQILPCVLDVLG